MPRRTEPDPIPWKGINVYAGVAGVVMWAVAWAFLAGCAKSEQNRQAEEIRLQNRWTDKNRWE
jgi:hypothetical protein